MAGSYPDVPSRRMAWDDDGTVAFYGGQDGGDALTELTALQMAELNDEDNTGLQLGGVSSPQRFIWHIFPELRELDGFYASRNSFGAAVQAVHTSPDTTNGRDGVWTQVIASADQVGTVPATYRTSIISTAVSSIRGVRVGAAGTSGGAGNNNQGFNAAHLYGEISAGQTPDRLLFIDDATGLEFTLPIDYGNVPRGSSADRLIRLRNNSAAKTANTIQYTAESLHLNSAAWYTATLPGGSTFQSTQQLASLAPATTSGLITLRRVVPNTEDLGVHAARLYANVDTWT